MQGADEWVDSLGDKEPMRTQMRTAAQVYPNPDPNQRRGNNGSSNGHSGNSDGNSGNNDGKNGINDGSSGNGATANREADPGTARGYGVGDRARSDSEVQVWRCGGL